MDLQFLSKLNINETGRVVPISLCTRPSLGHLRSDQQNRLNCALCVCLQGVPLNNERQPSLQQGVITCCSAIHQSVERASLQYFEELRRHNYVS